MMFDEDVEVRSAYRLERRMMEALDT